jgi:hypothetical protein
MTETLSSDVKNDLDELDSLLGSVPPKQPPLTDTFFEEPKPNKNSAEVMAEIDSVLDFLDEPKSAEPTPVAAGVDDLLDFLDKDPSHGHSDYPPQQQDEIEELTLPSFVEHNNDFGTSTTGDTGVGHSTIDDLLDDLLS